MREDLRGIGYAFALFGAVVGGCYLFTAAFGTGGSAPGAGFR